MSFGVVRHAKTLTSGVQELTCYCFNVDTGKCEKCKF